MLRAAGSRPLCHTHRAGRSAVPPWRCCASSPCGLSTRTRAPLTPTCALPPAYMRCTTPCCSFLLLFRTALAPPGCAKLRKLLLQKQSPRRFRRAENSDKPLGLFLSSFDATSVADAQAASLSSREHSNGSLPRVGLAYTPVSAAHRRTPRTHLHSGTGCLPQAARANPGAPDGTGLTPATSAPGLGSPLQASPLGLGLAATHRRTRWH